MKKSIALLVAVGVLVMSGCRAPTAPAAADASGSSQTTPFRKPGLWRQAMLIEGAEAVQSLSLCLDAESDRQLAWWGGSTGLRQGCTRNDVRQLPSGAWRFASRCESPTGVITEAAGEAVGNFEEKYQLKAVTTVRNSPVLALLGTRTVSIDAEWIGPCPSGMMPGDVRLETGQSVNLLKLGPPGAP
jgi:hypothetical protein